MYIVEVYVGFREPQIANHTCADIVLNIHGCQLSTTYVNTCLG